MWIKRRYETRTSYRDTVTKQARIKMTLQRRIRWVDVDKLQCMRYNYLVMNAVSSFNWNVRLKASNTVKRQSRNASCSDASVRQTIGAAK